MVRVGLEEQVQASEVWAGQQCRAGWRGFDRMTPEPRHTALRKGRTREITVVTQVRGQGPGAGQGRWPPGAEVGSRWIWSASLISLWVRCVVRAGGQPRMTPRVSA